MKSPEEMVKIEPSESWGKHWLGVWTGSQYEHVATDYSETIRLMAKRIIAAIRDAGQRGIATGAAIVETEWDDARDTVLNRRHECEEPCLDSDQTNAVLSVLDRHREQAERAIRARIEELRK